MPSVISEKMIAVSKFVKKMLIPRARTVDSPKKVYKIACMCYIHEL